MAQNVDLMVVGTSDNISAAELTQRLIAEFGQSGEAFSELVAAACEGAPPYAAQSKVSLDTAVEGQMQLEKLGVVCQVVMDGKVMGEHVPAKPAVAVVPEDKPSAVAPLEPEPEPLESLDQFESIDSTPAGDADAQEHVSVSPTPDASDVSFGDELDLLGDSSSSEDSTAEKSTELEDLSPAVSELEDDSVSFDDELGSLDEEVERTREKIKEQAAKSAAPVTESKVEPAELNDSDDIATDDSDDELSAELVLDLDGMEGAAANSQNADSKTVAESGAVEELALSLSLDDSGPLTKPKEKSGKIADDGGLTLSLDDDTPLTTPKKAAANSQIDALDESLNVEETPATEAKPEPSEAALVASTPEPEIVAPPEVVKEHIAVEEARDTSREPKEEVAPILDEPEKEEPASTNEPDGTETPQPDKEKPQPDTSVESKNEPAPTTATEPVVKTAQPAPETEPFVANSLNSLIEDLSSNSGGLVLPGQGAAETQKVDETPSSEPAAAELTAIRVTTTEEEDEDDGAYGKVEVIVDDDGKVKLIKTAVAASVVAGLLGAGAVYFISGGLGSKAVIPQVAQVAPVNENSAFDAVEEVSLNAALKRSSDANNPNNYSTEELIAYLKDDLGENARQELQNYVSGDGIYEVSQQSVPRMGAAIPADSNSVLWLKNRVAHNADKYFDEWTKREVDLQAYMELQERLIEVGDLEIARDVSGTTKDKLFAVMSLQRLARSYNELGHSGKAMQLLEQASRSTYGIASEAERTIAIADYALSEKELDLEEDSLDSFLKASILARSLSKPESRTVALSAIAGYFQRAGRNEDMEDFLELAIVAAYELPVNTAARDLAIRHVALTEVSLGLASQATDHANLIVDPFAAVSALHGIALELERVGDNKNARLTLNMAYRAGSLIKNSEKRDKLLEKIKLSGG